MSPSELAIVGLLVAISCVILWALLDGAAEDIIEAWGLWDADSEQ